MNTDQLLAVNISADRSTHLAHRFLDVILTTNPHTRLARLGPALHHNALVADGWECLASEAVIDGLDGIYRRGDIVIRTDCYLKMANAWVTAPAPEAAELACMALVETYGEPVDEDDGKIDVGFWSGAPAYRQGRRMSAPSFADIIANYPPAVATQLAALATGGPRAVGKLVVLSSDPGAGKTTFLRALAREWYDEARFEVMSAPEMVLEDPESFRNVTEARSAAGESASARVLLFEDLDPGILNGSHRASGGLSRLLNGTDGMLSDDLDITIIITTNVPATTLDPALLRPGRMRASICFDRFEAAEAAAWLGMPIRSGTYTLAELFEARRTEQPPGGIDPGATLTGTYL